MLVSWSQRKPLNLRYLDSQWNIGGVGYPTQNLRIGHVHFMFLCRFHLRWAANANTVFSGILALYSRVICDTGQKRERRVKLLFLNLVSVLEED